MLLPHWHDPNRKRICTLSYTDPDFSKFYDLDKQDFKSLVLKLKAGQRLTSDENDRYRHAHSDNLHDCTREPKIQAKA